MKRNLLYLAGLLIAAIGIFSGCDEDTPSYSSLTTDTQELLINFDETAEGTFQMIQGNGNYKVTSSNEEVATAIVDGNIVKVTALKAGKTNLTITDWAKMSTNVQVIVDQMTDLVLTTGSTTMYPEENKTINIYTGNREYKVSVDDNSIVKATVNEEGQIQITSLTPGNAKITVTDRLNKKTELSVKVIKRLVVENTDPIDYLLIDTPVTIKILDGNGGYTCNNNGSATYLACEMSENGTEVTIKGLKRYRFNKTVTIRDKEGQSVDIHITYIDEPYLEATAYNFFLKTSVLPTANQSFGINKVGEVVYSEELNIAQIISKSNTSATTGGYAVEFSGNLEVGDKSNATMYKVTKGVVDKTTPFTITDCRIDKVEDGWYWVSFLQEGCTLRSYIITKAD